ncbi:hydroxymethylglutaryl-CoA synthase family protein [Chloroflexi bacterium TSY]|nr:hydroxymethylglutaryl-CoA synthase family protein [Chloroflexi bacterium TSY]
MDVGIEAINAYVGQTYLDVRTLFEARGLDLARFDNLMMEKKAVGLPCEDPVTNGVNAAKPIIDQLDEADKNSIELLITATESGLDFGKSLSTYIHDYLGLSRQCRLFEMKQACYAGTAALQMAVNYVAAQPFNVKALVVATDAARSTSKETYAEPSMGIGAVAMLVSRQPDIMAMDLGANGLYSYEVMDTCRPRADIELGDPDLSLLAYLDCLEGAYQAYTDRVDGVDFQKTFDYMAFHTPFAGMVKGAHRKLMRGVKPMPPAAIDADFQTRMGPSLVYCVEVGNIYSATVHLALCSLIDNADIQQPKRLGLFSYGSGCSSEFYSGVVTQSAKEKLSQMQIGQRLANRHELSMAEYDSLLDINDEWLFGIQDKAVEIDGYANIYDQKFAGHGLLVLHKIEGFHRVYEWS